LQDGQIVHQSPKDAEAMIVQCAPQCATERSELNIVADDSCATYVP